MARAAEARWKSAVNKPLFLYLAFVNLIAFALFGIDKKRAEHGEWRIRESTLILSALIGGSYGAWFGMKVFHHKTRKTLFAVGIPFIAVIETAVLALYYAH